MLSRDLARHAMEAATGRTSPIASMPKALRARLSFMPTEITTIPGRQDRRASAWTGTKVLATRSRCRATAIIREQDRVPASTYNPPANFILDGTAHLSGANVLWRWRRTLGEKKDFQFDAYYDQTSRHELNFGDIRNNFDVDFIDRFPLPRQEI